LRKALKNNPNLDYQRRSEALLERMHSGRLLCDELRLVRAVHVLEQIGSEEVGQLLATLAEGAAAAPPTQEAKTALDRLRRRLPAKGPSSTCGVSSCQ
jgi:hypothetical protein